MNELLSSSSIFLASIRANLNLPCVLINALFNLCSTSVLMLQSLGELIRNGYTYLFIKRTMVGNSCLVTCLRNCLTEVILSPVITWLLRIFSASAFCLIFSGDKVFSLLSGGVSFLKSYLEEKNLRRCMQWLCRKVHSLLGYYMLVRNYLQSLEYASLFF